MNNTQLKRNATTTVPTHSALLPQSATHQYRSSLNPDVDMADHFLHLLDPTTDEFTFLTLPDSKEGKKSGWPRPTTIHGRFWDHVNDLVDLNRAGAGIFVTVQDTDGEGRRKENITRIRAVFQEADEGDEPELPVTPHITVQSSPGQFHRYILVCDAPIDEFNAVQNRLVSDYKSDSSAKDLSRVLRLPGFFHQKNPSDPHMVLLLDSRDAPAISWSHLKEIIPPVHDAQPSGRQDPHEPSGSGTLDPDTIQDALSYLDPDMEYNDWLSVGMALHSTGAGSEAFQLWDAWSQRGEKYSNGVTRDKWASFRHDAESPVTLGTLYHMARQAGWSGTAKSNANSQTFCLDGHFSLTHSSGKKVTVNDILANTEAWHGEQFADPWDSGCVGGLAVASASLRNGGQPYIYSQASGGRAFPLTRTPAIVATAPGEMPRVVQEADTLLENAGEVYQREGTLVRVVDGGVYPVAAPWLRTHLESIAKFQRFDKRANKWLTTDAPKDLDNRILANRGGWSVPELTSVVRGPILRHDGSMLDKPGYDPDSGMLLVADSPAAWPDIPHSPSDEEVREAVRTLWEPFEHFPFADDLSRSVALAACLTAVQRPMLGTAPAFAANSYKAGTGKGKLAKSIAWLSGNEPTESSWSPVSEEQRKRIMAKLITAPPSLLIDNVNGALDSDTLCAVLTSTTYEDRRLGASENITVPTRVLFLATGNNIQVTGDLSRRVLVSTIDHGVESPERLAFSFDPVARIREQWLHYRAAVLTILRGFIHAGSPKLGTGQMGSFEEWDALIRQCVIWLRDLDLAPFGLADPADAVSVNYNEDPDTMKLRALIAGWTGVLGTQPIKLSDLSNEADNAFRCRFPSEHATTLHDSIHEIAGEGNGNINPRRLGRWIERHAGRVVDGRRIVKDGVYSGTNRWRMENAT